MGILIGLIVILVISVLVAFITTIGVDLMKFLLNKFFALSEGYLHWIESLPKFLSIFVYTSTVLILIGLLTLILYRIFSKPTWGKRWR